METLPQKVLLKFMKGEHVMRHQQSYWNGIWLDMYINTNFMHYGQDPGEGDIVGVTLKTGVVKQLANSLQFGKQKSLDKLRDLGTTKDLEFHMLEKPKAELRVVKKTELALETH